MRRLILPFSLLALAAAAPAGLETIAATEADLRAAIADAAGGATSLPWSFQEAARALPANKRVEAVKFVIELARRFVQSPAFLEEYKTRHPSSVPPPPEKARTAAEIRAQTKLEGEQGIAQAEAMAKGFPAAERKAFAAELVTMRKQLAEQLANTAFFEELAKGDAERYERDKAWYEEETARAKAEATADPRVALRTELARLLDETKDVKFDAKLTSDGGLKYFADPDLESRSPEWKRCYRAGKEACGAARSAVKAWLDTWGR